VKRLRHSHLKEMAKSPAHYRIAVDRADDSFSSPAMEFGTAVHSLVLGGKPVIYYPGATRRGKDWDEFKVRHASDLILSKSDYDRAHRCADQVMSDADAVRVLTGDRERELHWAFMGRECQSTPDCIGASWISDLKTCASAEPNKFGYMARQYLYHSQLAFYGEAVRTLGICEPTEFYLVAIESSGMIPPVVQRLTPAAVEAGNRIWRSLFERVLQHEAANVWPGYSQTIVELDVPEEDELVFDDEPETEAA
jgi:hypothetical protein